MSLSLSYPLAASNPNGRSSPIPIDSEHDAVARANDSEYELSGSVGTGNAARGLRVAEQMHVGKVSVSGGALTNKTPVGGFKSCGSGREKGLEALHQYAQIKTISLSFEKTQEEAMSAEINLEEARALRRAMLGDDYVDSQIADPNPTMGEFQDYVTSTAWGVWTRGGALSTRDRSLLVLAMTAALGRMDEFRLHVSATSRTGVSDVELDELLFQVAAYCGVPAGISAKRALLAVRAELNDGQR
jgi:4-carboxymuconolactone decarboxylase